MYYLGCNLPRRNGIVTAELRDGGLVLMMDSQPMKTFELFVHDDRYSVPTLHLIPAVDVGVARTTAEVLWRASPHYQGVELWCDGDHVVSLGACEDRRRGPIDADPLRAASAG